MKCKICGYRSNTIASMASHYRKKHPRKMISVKARHLKTSKQKYCPNCGKSYYP